MIPKNLFPFFTRHPDITYLDSSATSLKPESVISAERAYEESYSANIGRGLYPIAEQATSAFERARQTIARFIHALPEEIIFTSGTTHGINLTAQLLDSHLKKNDTIITTELEHHSNFLPWKELARRKNIELRIAPVTNDGLIDIDGLVALIDEHTRIVAFTAISNVTGGINPISDIIRMIRRKNPGCITIVDAAQAIGHIPIDVTKWNADFIAFSGHKAYGPTGIGVLYGRKELLESCVPVSFGGGMVMDSCGEKATYREIPHRFEAGTPHISGAIGLGSAIEFIEQIGLQKIREHDIELCHYAIDKLTTTFGDSIHILGPIDHTKRSAIVSFALDGIHPHDLAHILGEAQICIRAGEHCAKPLHQKLNLPATARISFGVYTDTEDIDRLIETMKNALLTLNHQ